MQKRCKSLNRDGEPCSAPARAGRDWCPWHDPELAPKRGEWKARGGRGRSNAARRRRALQDAAPQSLADVKALLHEAMAACMAGTLAANRASALAALARAIGDIERVTNLEQQIAAIQTAEAARAAELRAVK